MSSRILDSGRIKNAGRPSTQKTSPGTGSVLLGGVWTVCGGSSAMAHETSDNTIARDINDFIKSSLRSFENLAVDTTRQLAVLNRTRPDSHRGSAESAVVWRTCAARQPACVLNSCDRAVRVAKSISIRVLRSHPERAFPLESSGRSCECVPKPTRQQPVGRPSLSETLGKSTWTRQVCEVR